ncbi:baseplate tail tube [Vibrio phage YC]|uniref:Baseplate tail tube n=1 Tax=Vibrio phage YC TaxID=2267403 RepID=A0A384ZRZ3_9CAUD|nr:tail tube protein [Vibrio phage YC]AXC34400.1 baseplate tail tube [Vibrio phage YC]
MSELTNFLAHVTQYGLGRKNRFRVTIPLPQTLDEQIEGSQGELANWLREGISIVQVMRGGLPNASRGLQVMCSNLQLPGSNILTEDVKHTGHTIKIAQGSEDTDIEIGFLLSRDMVEYHTLGLWRDLIHDRRTGKLGYYDDYVTDVTIEVLDEYDRIATSMTLIDAWPILSTPVDYDRASSDEFQIINTTWTYKTHMDTSQLQSAGVLDNVGIIEDLESGNYSQALYGVRQSVLSGQGLMGTSVGRDIQNMIGNIVEGVGEGNKDILSGALSGINQDLINGIQGLDASDTDRLTSLIQQLTK